MATEKLHEAHEVFPPELLAQAIQDPYPAVLELIGRVLTWGVNTAHAPIESEEEGGIMSEREANVLVAIATVARVALDQMDQASIDLVPNLGS